MMKMFLNFINTLKRLKDHLNLDSLKSGVGLIKIMQKFLTIILIIALVYLIYKFILTDMFYISKFFNNSLQREILNFSNNFEKFQTYIDSLSEIGLLSLMNLICLGGILYLFTSLVSILLGHELIQRMRLEERFVKLAKYLNFRKTFLSYNLITLIILVYTVSITYFIINLLIFIQFH